MNDPKLTVLSFGGGQDSTAILYQLLSDPLWRARYAPRQLIVVMADTGNEFPETYAHIEEVKETCKSYNVPFYFLTKDQGYHSDKWPSLVEFYERTSTVGSKRYVKSCTDNLKIKPIYSFLARYVSENFELDLDRLGTYRTRAPLVAFERQYGKIQVLLGIAAGEERRVGKADKAPKWMRIAIERRYPLIEEGWDRARCQDEIKARGYAVPVPSNCMRCPFMDERELLYLSRSQPEEFLAWADNEEAKFAKYAHLEPERNLGVWGKPGVTLWNVLEEAEEKYGHMTTEALAHHRFSHGHCTATSY